MYYESLGGRGNAQPIQARPPAGDWRGGSVSVVLAPFGLAQGIWTLPLYRWHGHAALAIRNTKRAGQGFTVRPQYEAGAGGIREIEFFTQTRQLICGWAHPDLAGAPVPDEGHGCYCRKKGMDSRRRGRKPFCDHYRAHPHRRAPGTMIRDRSKPHTLPQSGEGFAVLAAMMTMDLPRCAAILERRLKRFTN